MNEAGARFIEDIKARTKDVGPGGYRPTKAPDSAWTRAPDRAFGGPEIEDPPARFLEELEALGGHGSRVASLAEARDYLVELAKRRGARRLVRWDVPELDELGVDARLANAGVEVCVWRDLEDFRPVAASADIGLSTAEWAIADTGSIVLASGVGKGRTVTLLPPTHIAVVPARKVLARADEVFELYAGSGLPSNLCFHSGPSRSGDIEMSLAIGVHGPGDVHVLLVG